MARIDFDLVWQRHELFMNACVERGGILACAARQIEPRTGRGVLGGCGRPVKPLRVNA